MYQTHLEIAPYISERQWVFTVSAHGIYIHSPAPTSGTSHCAAPIPGLSKTGKGKCRGNKESKGKTYNKLSGERINRVTILFIKANFP